MIKISDMSEREKQWQKESDFETLIRASQIIKDEERLKGAKEFAKQQKKSLDEILDSDYFRKIGFLRQKGEEK